MILLNYLSKLQNFHLKKVKKNLIHELHIASLKDMSMNKLNTLPMHSTIALYVKKPLEPCNNKHIALIHL
jgi:hypothetical protein